MRAYIPPPGSDGAASVEMEPGDSLSRIVAEVSLPYLRRQLEQAASGRIPYIDAGDLPAWLRPEGDGTTDAPMPDDGRGPERWAYLLGEMIWAMQATLDWRRRMEGHIVERGEIKLVPDEVDPRSSRIHSVRPGTVDMEGVRSDGERLREGHRLFARYMRVT